MDAITTTPDQPQATEERAPASSTTWQFVRWALALAVAGLPFVLQAPAVICFAGAAALAVFWCWELDVATSEITPR
jgi:hypothetical protein